MSQRAAELALTGLALLGAVVLLPLAGAALAGRELAPIFRFPPPLEIPTGYPRWSWWAVALVLLPFAAVGAAWVRSVCTRAPVPMTQPTSTPHPRSLPWWGWGAAGWTAAWWLLAWTRWDWFAPLQVYTFFPLWLGFIVLVNALTHRAAGSCLMTRSPAVWLAHFGISAGFWWMFEWLNRFVHNWHYLAVEAFGPFGYAWHATLCFSTVLPAVAAVSEWLETRRGQSSWARGPAWPWFKRRGTGQALLCGGAVALVFTGSRPQEAYPALWGAPLALVLGATIWRQRPGVAQEIAAGDWRRANTWAFAALLCGFFWEMWNVHSLAKWIYTVPYVDRAHVFEMPLLGYLGYLPFGLECLVVLERVFPHTYPPRAAAALRAGFSSVSST